MKYIPAKRFHIGYPFHSSYASNLVKATEMALNFIEVAAEDLSQKSINLVCRGSSGAFISSIFYNVLMQKFPMKEIHIIYVRKDSESDHDYGGIWNYHRQDALWVYVDDLMCMGQTLKAAFNGVKLCTEFHKFHWVVCDTVEYRQAIAIAQECCYKLLTASQPTIE